MSTSPARHRRSDGYALPISRIEPRWQAAAMVGRRARRADGAKRQRSSPGGTRAATEAATRRSGSAAGAESTAVGSCAFSERASRLRVPRSGQACCCRLLLSSLSFSPFPEPTSSYLLATSRYPLYLYPQERREATVCEEFDDDRCQKLKTPRCMLRCLGMPHFCSYMSYMHTCTCTCACACNMT